MTWTPARARELAESCLGDMGDRWLHVQAVGRSAEQLQKRGYDVSNAVIMSAWLTRSPTLGFTRSTVLSGSICRRHPKGSWLWWRITPPHSLRRKSVAWATNWHGSWLQIRTSWTC